MYGIQRKNSERNGYVLCGLHPYSMIMQENGMNICDEELFVLLQLFCLECYFLKDGMQMDEITDESNSFCLIGIDSFSEKAFNDLSNVYFYKINVQDNEDVLEKINYYIGLGKKLIVFADVFYLGYHPLNGKYHSQSQIIISEKKEDAFYITDYHVPTFPISEYGGWILKTELGSSLLLGKNSEQKEESGIITYTIKERNICNVFNIRESVKQNFEKYLECNFSELFTIKAKIINSIQMIGKLTDEKMKKKLFLTTYIHMTGRAGIIISRRIMAEVLVILGCRENEFMRIADIWQGIAGCFFRLSLNYMQDKLEEVCFRISEVIDREYEEADRWRKNLRY